MNDRRRFDEQVLPHLDAAFNLARWLLRDAQAAEDAVQDAAMRALRHIGSLRGDDGRPWFLGIVRNTCFTALERARSLHDALDFDEARFEAALASAETPQPGPEQQLQRQRNRVRVDAALRALSPVLREAVVLRELEELSYEEIARIAGVPQGTVMSRLSRAREKLRVALAASRLGD